MERTSKEKDIFTNVSESQPCCTVYLVLVRLIQQMSGLCLGVVIVLWHNPVTDFIMIHFPVFVQVSKIRELLPLGLDPVWFWTPILMCKHVRLNQNEESY